MSVKSHYGQVQASEQAFTHQHTLPSPVGLWEQDGGVWLADEVLISHLADGELLLLSTGKRLQRQRRLLFWPQHAEVRR